MSRSKLVSWWLPIAAGVIVVLLLLMAWLANETRPREAGPKPSATRPARTREADPNPPPANSPSERLWARPQQGHPIELDYLPMGVQAVVRVRLAALLEHAEGVKILRSLGPDVPQRLEQWLQPWGIQASAVDSLTIGLLPQGTTLPRWAVIGRMTADNKLSLGNRHATPGGSRSATARATRLWIPDDASQLFIMGDAALVESLQHQSPSVPLLRRELEDLHQATHHTDHLSVLANPNFFRDEAQGLFAGPRRRLLDGCDGFWSDQAQAVCCSVQLTPGVAWAELRIIAREDWAPRRLQRHVERQLSNLSPRVTDYLGRIHLDPYWQPLAVRFPEMLRFVADQARIAVEGKQVAVTTALPVEAIHNLLLASELALASPLRSTGVKTESERAGWTRRDVLANATSIRIAQKSLEAAAADIVRQVRDELPGLPFEFDVQIRGSDLQDEGITRNQQIRDFVHVERPVAEILTALVMQANPVPGITTSADPRQKLVWVEAPDTATIWVTTRTAAAAHGWELPSQFRP